MVHKYAPYCLTHWERHELIRFRFRCVKLSQFFLATWLVKQRGIGRGDLGFSGLKRLACFAFVWVCPPATFTRVCSSLLAAELPGLLCCRMASLQALIVWDGCSEPTTESAFLSVQRRLKGCAQAPVWLWLFSVSVCA